jgi:hypothetical protein
MIRCLSFHIRVLLHCRASVSVKANRGYAWLYANCPEGLVAVDPTRDYSAAIAHGRVIYASHSRAAACCHRPDEGATAATSAGIGAWG